MYGVRGGGGGGSNNIFSHIVAVGVPSKSLILQEILDFFMGEYEFKMFRARFVRRKALRKKPGRDRKGALDVQSFTL